MTALTLTGYLDKRNGRTKTCVQCGELFQRNPNILTRQWKAQRFCSRACHSSSMRGRPASDRLAEHIFPEPNSGCWLWYGSVSNGGYGQLSINRKPWRAHRLAYELMVGPIPEGLSVLHKCDTPACVNPDHLYLGEQQDNARDMVERGRSLTGTRNHATKLTPTAVRQIRSAPTTSNAEFARRYGVSAVAVRNARIGRTWGTVS